MDDKNPKKVRQDGIKHFTDGERLELDNQYGDAWSEIVNEYLKNGYMEEGNESEVVVYGKTYKILRRRLITGFYDENGNTLFDVENKRLEKEHDLLTNSGTGEEGNPGSGDDSVIEESGEEPEREDFGTEKTNGGGMQAGRTSKQQAEDKLRKEMAAAKDKSFAEPIIGYLLRRCREDEGLAEDVAQGHKTWKKCFDYIYSQARKQAVGNCVAVRDEVVYEWAEDYYHKDDKAEEEREEREKAERGRKAKQKEEEAEGKAKAEAKLAAPVAQRKEKKPKEALKPKKSSKDMDGQLDMFAMMGM